MSLLDIAMPTMRRENAPSNAIATGVSIGLAGGLAEIAIVWPYCAATGIDPGMIARNVANAAGFAGGSAALGVSVHMALAVCLGVGLAWGVAHVKTSKAAKDAFLIGSLALVWAINFFVILPAISPSFVSLLPYSITLGSKLAFGLAAALTLRLLHAAAPQRA